MTFTSDETGIDAALRHAATEPAVHRHHAQQKARRAGRQHEGRRHSREERQDHAAVRQATGAAGASRLSGTLFKTERQIGICEDNGDK